MCEYFIKRSELSPQFDGVDNVVLGARRDLDEGREAQVGPERVVL